MSNHVYTLNLYSAVYESYINKTGKKCKKKKKKDSLQGVNLTGSEDYF